MSHEQLPSPDEPPIRGRHADKPRAIPWRGWKDLLARVGREIREDNLDLVAAGVAFYVVLALAPAFVALVSVYGLLASPADVTELLEPMFMLMPNSSARILVHGLLTDAVEAAPESLTFTALFAILLSLWSANRGMKALVLAVGVAYEEPERPSVVRENLRSLGFVAVAVVVLVCAGVVFIGLPRLIEGSWIGGGMARLLELARVPVMFAVVLVGLSSLYRWGPNRRPPKWRWVGVGSVVAALLWLAITGLLSVYLTYAGGMQTGDESLDAVVAVLVWVYASIWTVLLGAELNAELEHQTAVDSTIGEDAPIGERGAFVADHIGAARTRTRTRRYPQQASQQQLPSS